MRRMLCVDWGGRACSDKEIALLQNVAVRMLRMGDARGKVHFSHDLCEGTMVSKGDGMIGHTPGTLFDVTFGTVNGTKWFFNFLLVRGSELAEDMDTGSIVVTVANSSGSVQMSFVDAEEVSIKEDSARGRGVHRLN